MMTSKNNNLMSAVRGILSRSVVALGATLAAIPGAIGAGPVGQSPKNNQIAAPAPIAAGVKESANLVRLAELQSLAVAHVAGQKQLPIETLEVTNASVAEFPLQGSTGFAYKLIDVDGGIHGVLLNENGEELDSQEMLAAEKAVYESTFGRVHPDLAEIVPFVGDNETVPVIIWLREDSQEAMARPDPRAHLNKRSMDLVRVQVESARQLRVAEIAEPVAAFLMDEGFAVATDVSAPVVYTELDPATIEKVAQLPEVDMVYLDEINEPTLATARAVIGATTVHSRGYTGTGVKVGEIEVGGRVNTSNPYLSGVVQDMTYSCLHSHATAVAGMIRSTHSTSRGIAPASSLWIGGSCGGWSSELQNRTNAAVSWGARVLNNSWGSTSGSMVPDANAKFFDNIVLNSWRTVVFAAGNRGGAGCSQGTDGVVTNPAIAYNVIAVGNFDDKGTTATGDDTMNPCSSWKNPTSAHGDRQKPEVSAPGTNITSTTNASPWTANTGSGTSYSAPMVTGTAALMIQRNSSLGFWPEAVKAILMATAVQNIEGAARLSEYDGAGGIRADLADDVTRGVNGSWNAQGYTCSEPATKDVMNMSLTAGKRTRVAIVWDNDPAYASYASQPCADLDLQIISPSNTVVASSSSWDNTFEIVDFTPSASGVYRIRVVKYRCDMSPRYLGFAFYRFP